ncbi:MAG: Gfo/Idh/MocA family oxidoreductase [Acidimicrobiales bacterium]
MKQVVQAISGGPVRVEEVPWPIVGPTEVLVRTMASLISPGTERAVTGLAQSSLLAKARARPDLVRQVMTKAKTEGLAATSRAVRTRLGGEMPLGYSAAGIAVEVGEHVMGVAPGQLVATAGAGANHAEVQAVPGLLCAVVPPGVPAADAAFATVASIALHGLRLAEVGPGSKVVVVGLGLVGQLALRLAQASGCEVAGIDVAEFPVNNVAAAGGLAWVESGQDTTAAVFEWSRGRGADAVLVAASGKSSSAMLRVPSLCRDRATIVVIGDVGLGLERTPLYEKELCLRLARSYGPGRYERTYEDWGVDYPPGQVRWTEGRNLEAVLDLLAGGRLVVSDLITHCFDIAAATDAYRLIENGTQPYLGVELTYEAEPAHARVVRPMPRRGSGSTPGVGLVGAGAFASAVLVPALKEAGFDRLVAVASASGLSASRFVERNGFERALSGAGAVIEDAEVGVVVVATPHESHSSLVIQALEAGKHVFCEKPLALTGEELDQVETAWRQSGAVLFVGFNRRWSKPVALACQHFGAGFGPLVITYRVSAGQIPENHWYHDRRQGGRLLGEVCHFIDTCGALVGSDPTDVHAMGSGGRELALPDDLVVALRYADGSLAAITYASRGDTRTEKEEFQVLGRGHTVVVQDFRKVILDGKASVLSAQDKGHVAEARAFARAIETCNPTPAWQAIASSRATLRALASLRKLGDGRGSTED